MHGHWAWVVAAHPHVFQGWPGGGCVAMPHNPKPQPPGPMGEKGAQTSIMCCHRVSMLHS